jgi:hypothetical protein
MQVGILEEKKRVGQVKGIDDNGFTCFYHYSFSTEKETQFFQAGMEENFSPALIFQFFILINSRSFNLTHERHDTNEKHIARNPCYYYDNSRMHLLFL